MKDAQGNSCVLSSQSEVPLGKRDGLPEETKGTYGESLIMSTQ